MADLIKTIVASTPQTAFTFLTTDIPSSGYTNLRLVVQGRSTSSDDDVAWGLQINDDALPGRYAWQQVLGIGTTEYISTGGTYEQMSVLGRIPGITAGAALSGAYVVTIPNYLLASTFLPTFISRGVETYGASGNLIGAGVWSGTYLGGVGAITQLTLVPDDGLWEANSQVQLWAE